MLRPKLERWLIAVSIPGLIVSFAAARQPCDVTETSAITAAEPVTQSHFGSAVAVDGDVAVVGADNERSEIGRETGAAYVFRFDGTSWQQEAKLNAPDPRPEAFFGNSVAVRGHVVLVGARRADASQVAGTGAVYVYRFDGQAWEFETKLTGPDPQSFDSFGHSVSLSGSVAIVGAPFRDVVGSNSGAAYVFRFDGGGWRMESELIPDDPSSRVWFGRTVSVDSGLAVVGATPCQGCQDRKGAAYVFRFDESMWRQEAKLVAADMVPGDFFGYAVSLSGNVAVIGSPESSAGVLLAGAAYVFRRNSEGWIEEAQLTARDGERGDFFGRAVGIDEGTIVVGAIFDIDSDGSVYAYRYDGVRWHNSMKMTASDAGQPEFLGDSVAVQHDVIMSGAIADDRAAPNAGAVYFFQPSDRCDIDCDGRVDAFDIEPFIDLLLGGGSRCGPCTGDANDDGEVDDFDIEPFLNCLFP